MMRTFLAQAIPVYLQTTSPDGGNYTEFGEHKRSSLFSGIFLNQSMVLALERAHTSGRENAAALRDMLTLIIVSTVYHELAHAYWSFSWIHAPHGPGIHPGIRPINNTPPTLNFLEDVGPLETSDVPGHSGFFVEKSIFNGLIFPFFAEGKESNFNYVIGLLFERSNTVRRNWAKLPAGSLSWFHLFVHHLPNLPNNSSRCDLDACKGVQERWPLWIKKQAVPVGLESSRLSRYQKI
jgi:hypothetical protein